MRKLWVLAYIAVGAVLSRPGVSDAADIPAKKVTVDGQAKRGYVIGHVNRGQVLLFQYVSGKWKAWGKYASENPDAATMERGDLSRLVIADGAASERRLAIVPGGTAQTPFKWTADRDYADLILRIHDTDGDFANNPPGKVVYKLAILTPGDVPVSKSSDSLPRTHAEISVPCAPVPLFETQEPALPTDSTLTEYPDFRDRPKALVRNQASITAMMVRTSDDGQAMGLTADIIATVDPASRRGSKAGVGMLRGDGDKMMWVALEEAVRAVKVRYPMWLPGMMELSFGEKFVAHGGPSAGTAFALLMLSILEGFELDPKCAITGDITVDWKVRKVGGVMAKVRGAALDKCLYAAIPDGNEASVVDMALLHEPASLWNIQVFSIATLQEALAVARKDRPSKLAEAIVLFVDVQAKLNKEKAALKSTDVRESLQKVLQLAPNHLSAKCLLALSQGTAPKTLSANGTMYHLSMVFHPYRELLKSKKKPDRAALPIAVTAASRKRIDALRPIADPKLMPLLRDIAAIVEVMEGMVSGQAKDAALKARLDALDATLASLRSDTAFLETLAREGY